MKEKHENEGKGNALSHHSDHARDCIECGARMTTSEMEDYGSLCRRCQSLDIGGKCVTDITKFPKHLQIRQVPWEVKR